MRNLRDFVVNFIFAYLVIRLYENKMNLYDQGPRIEIGDRQRPKSNSKYLSLYCYVYCIQTPESVDDEKWSILCFSARSQHHFVYSILISFLNKIKNLSVLNFLQRISA